MISLVRDSSGAKGIRIKAFGWMLFTYGRKR